jgi:hypothetical protein
VCQYTKTQLPHQISEWKSIKDVRRRNLVSASQPAQMTTVDAPMNFATSTEAVAWFQHQKLQDEQQRRQQQEDQEQLDRDMLFDEKSPITNSSNSGHSSSSQVSWWQSPHLP